MLPQVGGREGGRAASLCGWAFLVPPSAQLLSLEAAAVDVRLAECALARRSGIPWEPAFGRGRDSGRGPFRWSVRMYICQHPLSFQLDAFPRSDNSPCARLTMFSYTGAHTDLGTQGT